MTATASSTGERSGSARERLPRRSELACVVRYLKRAVGFFGGDKDKVIFAAFLGEGVELTGVGIIEKTEVVFAERKSRGAALKLGRQLFFPAVVAFGALKNASKLVFSQSTDERTSSSNSLLITHFSLFGSSIFISAAYFSAARLSDMYESLKIGVNEP